MVAPSTPAHRVTMHHAPDEEGIARITMVREATQNLIEAITDNCPPSSDRSAAIRHARDAMMNACAAIVVPQDDVAVLTRLSMLEAVDLDDKEMPF